MPTKPPKTIDPEEASRLLTILSSEGSGFGRGIFRTRNHTMALLMLDTGIRVGELVKLRLWDLYFGDHPVRNLIVKPEIAKTGKERVIPVSERLYDALLKMHSRYWSKFKSCAGCYAFFNELPNEPLSVRQVERIISTAGMAATGRKVTPHTLRHTFGTKLMRTSPTPVVQSLLGHARLSSTQIYQHPNHEDLKNAIDSLGG